LNFRIIFCIRSPESFEAAREERLKISGNPFRYNDLSPFIHEQELMRELIAQSILPSLTLDISDNNISAAVSASRIDWKSPVGSTCWINGITRKNTSEGRVVSFFMLLRQVIFQWQRSKTLSTFLSAIQKSE